MNNDRDLNTTKEWKDDNANIAPLFISRLQRAGFNGAQIEAVLQIVENTCTHCWDSDSGCQCWNDE